MPADNLAAKLGHDHGPAAAERRIGSRARLRSGRQDTQASRTSKEAAFSAIHPGAAGFSRK
jgi:hypothetical protein